ncbi:MAG TPA: hypothetical protein VD903_20615 [Pseudonocardia sp.]|nr:hypothetical protein [Pseudonocardia sp.]
MVVAVLALVACSSTVGGTPGPVRHDGPDGPVSALPMPPDQQARATRFATMREWDLCAMHDIPAATGITGFEPGALHPDAHGLDGCDLSLGAPGFVNLRTLRIAVTRMVRPDERPTGRGSAASPITVNGVRLPNVVHGADSCSYVYPLRPVGDESLGIEIGWYFHIGDDNIVGAKPPCVIVREYIAAIWPGLTDPPLRRAGLTTPALALADLDPCTVVATLLRTASGEKALTAQNTDVYVGGSRTCSASVRAGLFRRQSVGVEFSITSVPGAFTDTVAGRPADIYPGHWLLGDCSAEFQATDTEVHPIASYDHPYVEIMRIDVAYCDDEQQIRQLAELAAQLVPPTPPASPDAQPLGDLDPPPTAEDVGAPFDPCTAIGWAGYPPPLRPDPPDEPTPASVGPAIPYAVGCTFDHEELWSRLVWGTPSGLFTADPAARPGSTPVQFGDKPGNEHPSTTSTGRPHCYSAVQLADGIAAMYTSLPGGDPCAINRGVLTRLAAVVG